MEKQNITVSQNPRLHGQTSGKSDNTTSAYNDNTSKIPQNISVNDRDNEVESHRRKISHHWTSKTVQSSRNRNPFAKVLGFRKGSEDVGRPPRTREAHADYIKNNRSNREDPPLRKEDTITTKRKHTQDLISQKEMELAPKIDQKDAYIIQRQTEAEERSRDHDSRLKQKLDDYNAHDSKKDEEYARELNRRDENIKNLKISLAKLRQENKDLGLLIANTQENALNNMLKKPGWSPKEDPRVRDEFSKIHMKLRQWARDYGVLAFEDIEEVPAAEKDRIIGLLDEYSVETDWKTLITKVSISRNKIPAILLQSLLAKDVFEWVFGDPFFSFAEIDNTSSLPNSKEWKHIYREMIKVDEPEAHIWRSQTLRILSTVTNPSTESHLARRIRLLSSQKAAGFLTSPASLLLRQASKPGSGDKCTQDVQKLYHEVAEFALLLWTQRTFIKLYSQHELPKFYISNPKTKAHSLHHLDEDDTRLDGKDVLLFVQPAVVAFGNEDAENYDRSKIWAPATVMVDERS